ncbi:MAG: hypothetical protein KDC80_27985 [Saprospiraceae bacterium]|nr:hypothetical protein [Saprospiraceae bacterium]
MRLKLSDSRIRLTIFALLSGFITYSSMYAFRKPFTAGTYENLTLWNVDYKIILVVAQVLGYMLSKFIGIKIVSELQPGRRVRTFLFLMGVAWLSLLFFGLTPYPYNFIWLFFNGLPLGMIWGIVFSFLEGRRNTELLGAGMCVSFIVASGLVKSVGKYLMDHFHVAEFWMPFFTGMIFLPFLLLGIWMLSRLPSPSLNDIESRAARFPMNFQERILFFREFAPGIILVVIIYIAITIFRDLRDNFAVEIWNSLGYAGSPEVLLTAEIPIAIAVFIIIALMILIRNNRLAFYINILTISTGGMLLLACSFLADHQLVDPALWMILVGFGMYLSYVSFHTILFERWIAVFRRRSNIGFLMYVADAFGYLGSVAILLYKNFFEASHNWLTFIYSTSYIVGGITVILSMAAFWYFKLKEQSTTLGLQNMPQDLAEHS